VALLLRQLAEKIGAQCMGGNGELTITGLAPLNAASASEVSFFSNTKYQTDLKNTRAAAVIMEKERSELPCAKLIMRNPYLGWALATALFRPDRTAFARQGIHQSARVHPEARLGPDVHVGPGACIGARTTIGARTIIHAGAVIEELCEIGNDCEIHPNAVIHHQTIIGNNCVIWSGAVIGSYGFGYAEDNARFITIHQLGKVVIQDDVDIGANCAIDRGAVGDTVIKRGTKLDNMVHCAHNVEIGVDCAIAAQTGISGSVKIGNRVKIAGQVGFVGHIELGDDSFVGAKTGVSKNFPAKSILSGYPSRNLMDARRSDACLHKLPELIKKVRALENLVKKLSEEKKT